jgi:hypothetical protein
VSEPKKGARRDDVYQRDGVRWPLRVAVLAEGYPGEHTTKVSLRKEADGLGKNTHIANVSISPDMFSPTFLDGVPIVIDPNPSVIWS